MERKQYDEIDWLRAILVFLVVVGHALGNGAANLFESGAVPVEHCLHDWIYSFHMPLFMSVSGFVTSKYIYDIGGGWNARKHLIRKRFCRLMIPYFSIGAFYFLMKQPFNAYALGPYTFSDIWKLFLGQNPMGVLWFLYALFLINALTFACIRPEHVRIWLAASIIPLALYVMQLIPTAMIFKPLNLCAPYLFWYLLGVEIAHDYDALYRRFQARLGRIVIAAALAHTVTFSLSYAFRYPLGIDLWKQLCSCLAAVALYALGMLLSREGRLTDNGDFRSQWWRVLSKYSMDIYILHSPMIAPVRLICWNMLHFPFAVCALLKFMSGLFGSLAFAALILRKNAIYKKYLLGQGW